MSAVFFEQSCKYSASKQSLHKKNVPLDGQIRWAKSSSQLALRPLDMAFSVFHTHTSDFCKDILAVSSQFYSCRYSNICMTLVARQITNKQIIKKIFD